MEEDQIQLMSLLELYHEKWFKRVSGKRDVWVRAIKEAATLDAFVKGVATVTGLSEAEVRASIPASNYSEFQRNAEKYADVFIANIRKAYEQKKWPEHYRRAFSTRA
jgi:hypothetical protein